MTNLLWSAAFMVVVLSGCGWSGTPTRSNDFTPLTAITISAAYTAVAGNTSTTLTAEGDFSGLFTGPVTAQAVWSSDTPTVADFVTPSSPNRVTGLTPGSATLTATVRGVSASYLLTVNSATIASIAITPPTPSVAKGLNQQFAATGTFLDGTTSTTQDITFDAAWSSTVPGVATVSDVAAGKGLAQAVTVGTSTITASFGGVSGSTGITVTEPVLKSIALSLTNPSVLTLSTKRFTASGTYTDGSALDITSLVTWKSSDTGVATIAGDGTATALTQGATAISATKDGISRTTTLSTTGGNLTGIAISPIANSLVKDTVGRISATGTFSNASKRDITGAVKWTVTDPALASVTQAGGNLAWLNPKAVTLVPTTITAASGSVTATASLTVILPPSLSSIALFTTSLDLTAGTSSPLTVTATYSDGTTQDVTSLCTWTSSVATIATVGTSGLAAGRVTGVADAVATTTISATYGGKTVLAPATVTVRPLTFQNLTISSSSAVTVGNQIPYTALAGYLGGTAKDVTQETVWTLDSSNVAIMADSLNQPGQIVGVTSGTATLTASFGGKTQTATITVSGP